MSAAPPVPTVGSVLSFTPASGEVAFIVADGEFRLPMVGWAVVVTWANASEVETDVQPVVIIPSGGPLDVWSYVHTEFDTPPSWRVVV